MTFTKSWLQKQITDLEATRDEIPFGLDEDGNNTLVALKMALAGMEAVPAACPKCNDTGMADSGGVQPWGDGILVPCDCSLPEPELTLLIHDLNIDGNHRLANVIQDLIEVKKAAPQPLTTSERAELENYRNAQPDMNYQHLSELYHAQEKRLFKLAQRIKGPAFDKYAHSPSQAIDALESAAFGEREDEDCRAAMLQGAESVESRCSNSPVIPDGGNHE